LSIAPPVKAGENKTGKALSAIGGNIPITITDPAHQTQDVGTIRRDTNNTNTSLPGLPDLQNILRDQYKTQADLQAAQATMAGLVGDIASELYRRAAESRDQAGMDYWNEGGAGRVLLHTIGAGILGGVNGWEGALKGAAGAATSALLTPAIADLVKGMLKDSTLSDQDKQTLAAAIGSSLGGLAGAVGGGEGASYGAAQYQYNYLDHADNDALNAAKAACRGGDDAACAEKGRLEAKDKQQQDAMIACRPSGYNADGCGAVFASVIAALSSYSGTASGWFLSADEYRSELDELNRSGGLEQILKIMAPEGVDKLSPKERSDAAALITVLTGDPTGFTAIPSLVAKASNGDPLALIQVLAILTKFKASKIVVVDATKSVTCHCEFPPKLIRVRPLKDGRMKKQRFTEEQIIAVLKEQEAGAKAADLCRKHGISEATFYNWKAKYGGMEVSEAKRLKALEDENSRLKKLLAEQMLDAAALRELLAKKW